MIFDRTHPIIQEYIDRINVDPLAPDVSWICRDAQVVLSADDDRVRGPCIAATRPG